jgi:hypothetical protein
MMHALLHMAAHHLAMTHHGGTHNHNPCEPFDPDRYGLYSSATMLVLSTGAGVTGLTLDSLVGEFVVTHRCCTAPGCLRRDASIRPNDFCPRTLFWLAQRGCNVAAAEIGARDHAIAAPPSQVRPYAGQGSGLLPQRRPLL